MTLLKIALLQMTSCGMDRAANQAKGTEFVRQAHALEADIALFPEMWSIGYTDCPSDPAREDHWKAQAIRAGSDYVQHFRQLAEELDMAIAITYLEQWQGAPRNTVSLIDRHADIVLTYAKVHTCDFEMEAKLTPGDEFYVRTLDTAQGDVQIGAMICYDREFPESARILMLQGAEIILVPNACEIEANRMVQFRTRAYENMLGVAMTNYAAPQNNGHSVAFDGVAFNVEGGKRKTRDMMLVEAGESEGVYLATFDLDRLRDYRSREVAGNAYRKPSRYGRLVSAEVEPPFVRGDARR
jgi:predicted amidohydrolase